MTALGRFTRDLGFVALRRSRMHTPAPPVRRLCSIALRTAALTVLLGCGRDSDVRMDGDLADRVRAAVAAYGS